MAELSDYVLAIRTPGSPQAPTGVKTVELDAGDVEADADAVTAAIAALRASGLTAGDFRSRVIFLAPDLPDCLVTYAALCGFAGRRVDAYADGAVLEFSRLDPAGTAFPDAGRYPGHLMWAQVGGPEAAGMPTARLDPRAPGLVIPEDVTLIRYAARLRMVPPESPRDALAMFVLVAALRRRSDDRFPYLSSGTEPVPVDKSGTDQGIDLEAVRREAMRHRQELRVGRSAEIVPRVEPSTRTKRIADANAVDIRVVLRRLGASADETGLWHCPRPRKHSNGDENPSLRVYGDNRIRCHRCDGEKTGSLRLVVDVLGLTPDEAARFILDSDRVIKAA